MATFSNRRLERLLGNVEPKLRLEFLMLVGLVEETDDLGALEALLERGQIAEALRNLARASNKFAAAWSVAFVSAAEETEDFLDSIQGVIIDFDQANPRAIEIMRQNRLRLVRELSEQQREATRITMLEGIMRGENPRAMARRFRQSIGLAPTQARALESYRTALQNGERNALERALRDKRFDPTVERAVSGGLRLGEEQVNRMVERYREKLLAHRAEVIARTEGLRAVHMGTEEMFRQAIDAREIDPQNLVRTWNTASDSRVRDTHRTMNGQHRPFGEPFTSGSGAKLRYPGDMDAPAGETINCRCVVSTRVVELEEAGQLLAEEVRP